MPVQIQQMSIKQLSILYDRLYDIADRLFKKYNPCNIRGIGGKTKCACHLHSTYRVYLCCNECKYVSTIGCTVKCLPCKLFICNHIAYEDEHCRHINKKYSIFIKRLKWLRKIAIEKGISIHSYFHTKEEVLDISERRRL